MCVALGLHRQYSAAVPADQRCASNAGAVHGGAFDGKRIEVKGTVAEFTQVRGTTRNGKTTLVVADGAKKVAVFSNYEVLLKLNDEVVITGKFSKETSKIDATPIVGKIEVLSKSDEKKPEEKK